MSKSNNLPVNGQGMPETKQEKQQATNFTQISNEVLLDERLSFKARGILALLLSRPKDWKIYIDEIVERSDADGKHSVRTGFKELKALGYVNLVKVFNGATGKFEGTVYQLCLKPIKKGKSKVQVQKNLTQPKNFPTDEKTDVPKISRSEKPSVDNSDRPKTMTPSNTDNSNTKHSNTKIQQQQIKADDDVSLKNDKSKVEFIRPKEILKTATDLLPSLQNDEVWKKQFIGKNICKQVGTTEILTATKFGLLLKHFTQTSISSGTTYPNIAAIKRHFFNWFNANLNKNALPNYIEQQVIAPKKARKQVAALMPKTDVILNKIYGQQCDNEAHLYRCLQILETHLATYENVLQYLDTANKNAVNTWIADIENAKQLVERGQKAGQLSWFCKRTTTLLSGAKANKKVNHIITDLSQRFAVAQS
jgi:hypothetical protein